MTTKDLVLKMLENSKENISGQRLALKLGKSRCSIWKAVEALRSEGYEIEAVTNRGYRLIHTGDKLDSVIISAATDCDVTVFDSVSSTNTIAKERSAQGAKQGTTIIAEHQNAGRGRRGRKFEAAGKGIYLSIILHPNADYSHAPLITAAAAVAVCDAIKEVCSVDCQIKWVNDIFYKNRKICGILTEAVTDMESGTVESVVVGIGINFCGKIEDLPEEIREIAGFIFSEAPSVTRNELIIAVMRNLLKLSDSLEERAFIESYRKYCFVIGKRVEFNGISAVATDIDENCCLKIVLDNGEERILNSGEVSVRLG